MKITGGCYCGNVRYQVDGEPLAKLQCHCRECQHITGGGANFTMAVPDANFEYVNGSPAQFTRDDLEGAVTREFCGTCGAPLLTRAPGLPGAVLLKVGSMDKPEDFVAPDAAIYMDDSYDFHTVADGLPQFPKLPPL